jgi:two-component system nitrate/nitrite response regulator NarL
MHDLERTLARVGQREQAIDDALPGTAARGPRLAGAGHGHPRRVPFTSREKEVLTHMVHGECTQQIACSLDITEATVRTHVQNMLSKLGVHSRLEATIVAAQTGVLGEYYHGVPARRATSGR